MAYFRVMARPAFDIGKMERYHPPVSRAVAWFGAIQFVLLLIGLLLLLSKNVAAWAG